MTGRFMLDTDTVSYALQGRRGIDSEILKHRPSEICLSSITLAELRFGADRRASRKLHRIIDTFTATIEVVSFDEKAARFFGRVGSRLAASGVPIGQFDTLIAAHALALKAVLVTNNVRHFSRVPGLKVENWARSAP